MKRKGQGTEQGRLYRTHQRQCNSSLQRDRERKEEKERERKGKELRSSPEEKRPTRAWFSKIIKTPVIETLHCISEVFLEVGEDLVAPGLGACPGPGVPGWSRGQRTPLIHHTPAFSKQDTQEGCFVSGLNVCSHFRNKIVYFLIFSLRNRFRRNLQTAIFPELL